MENNSTNPNVPPAQPPKPVQPTQPAQPAAQPVAQPVQPVAQATQQPAAIKPVAGQPQKALPLKPEDKGPGKKFLLGCVTAFVVAILIFILVIFLFVGGPQAEGTNPLAKALGIDPGAFINTLIGFVHFFFGIIAFITFIMTMVGVFRTSMAKKDDTLAKKRGATTALVSGVMLILTLFLWAGAYYYLSQKVVERKPEAIVPPIATIPENILGLTAPITIEFDASGVPVNKTKHEVISYEWDFGDESTGTGVKVSHTYKEKGEDQGKYKVVLEVHKLDKKTAEEVTEPYTVTVSIANEKVNALFAVTPETGEAPLLVSFDASESSDPDGEIVKYDWDFNGDESFDDEEGVKTEYTFTKAGKYTVKLRVTDNSNDYSVFEKEVDVKAPSDPQAVIELESEVDEFLAGETYVFSAAASQSPNGKIEKYEWDFGDGTSKEKTKTVSHEFKTPGTYEVTLIVTDETDETAETFMEVKVDTESEVPVAHIVTTPAQDEETPYLAGEVPFEVTFDANTSTDEDDNIVDYEWDFDGDDVVDGVGPTKVYTFETPGTFTVTLKVTDADSNVAKDTLTVKAEEQGINAKVTANPITGPTPLKVTFDASGSTYQSGEIISYEWDFGDGSNKQLGDSKISHKYTKIGAFEASVTAIASDNERDTTKITVTVTPVALQACYTASKTQGPAPLIVIFDASCSEGTITKFLWNFGDEQTSLEAKPTHTFENVGTYTVSLEVTDNENTINTFEDTIVVTGEVGEGE